MKKLLISAIILALTIPFILTNCPTNSSGSTGPTYLFYGQNKTSNDTISKVRIDNTADKQDVIINSSFYSISIEMIKSLNRIIWVDNSSNGNIVSANLDDTSDTVTVYEYSSFDLPQDVDLDNKNKRIYFIITNPSKIGWKYFDGSGGQVQNVPELTNPQSMVIDDINDKLYIYDFTTKKIIKTNLDGSNIQDVATGLVNVADLEIDTQNKKLYVSNKDQNMIQTINLDNTSDIVNVLTGLHTNRSITLDLYNNKIYWDESGTTIKRANLDGSNVEVFLTGLNVLLGMSIY
jgi:hypothetical protein